MDYRNTETKLDQLVGYFNEEKINLSPIFQRGRVWPVHMRRELMKNIIRRRPIPAIFLYKDEAGSKYTYAILDGKQRLESILMFIGERHRDLAIRNWRNYIFGIHRKDVEYWIDLKDGRGKLHFADLTDKEIRDLREYPIPTIEIALNENTQLDEIISLFVDINQYGEKVTRVNIVRAIKRNDPFLKSVYAMIAEKQARKQDVFTRKKHTPYATVLKKLQIISSVTDPDVQADRMWERLFELALFVRSGGVHRKPTEILKTFIKTGGNEKQISTTEKSKLSRVFTFLQKAYAASPELAASRLAMDQTHFYTMVTTMLDGGLFDVDPKTPQPKSLDKGLVNRLVRFSKLITDKAPTDPRIRKYMELSSRQTTDAERRKERQNVFREIMFNLSA